MNGIYFIPILAVVFMGMVSRRVPAVAAKIALVCGFAGIAIGYFVPPFDAIVASLHEFHFLGIVFAYLIILMLVIGELYPMEPEFVQKDVRAVDMTRWEYATPVGIGLLLIIGLMYIAFADFSILQ
jgi:SSS family solute:Na+ symporter